MQADAGLAGQDGGGGLERLAREHTAQRLRSPAGQRAAARDLVGLYVRRYAAASPEALLQRMVDLHLAPGALFFSFYARQLCGTFCGPVCVGRADGEDTLQQLLAQLLLAPLQLHLDATTHGLFGRRSELRVPHTRLAAAELALLHAVAALPRAAAAAALAAAAAAGGRALYVRRLALVHHLFLFCHALVARARPAGVVRALALAWTRVLVQLQAEAEAQAPPPCAGLFGLIDIFTRDGPGRERAVHVALLAHARAHLHAGLAHGECRVCAALAFAEWQPAPGGAAASAEDADAAAPEAGELAVARVFRRLRIDLARAHALQQRREVEEDYQRLMALPASAFGAWPALTLADQEARRPETS